MNNLENKFRLIAFVPIGYIANLWAVIALITIPGFIFFGWADPYIIDPELPFEMPISQEKLLNIGLILEVPCSVLGYKVSHLIKPANLTNKNFINIQFFIIGVLFVYKNGQSLLFNNSSSPLYAFFSLLIDIVVLTLMIKDRRFNLFNMGGE